METPFSKDIKKDLNKLERTKGGVSSSSPVARATRPTLPAVVGVGTSVSSSGSGSGSSGSGLDSPLTMEVTVTKTINIPVPTGATSVDVQVVQKYNLIDASGEVFEVTVEDYP